MALNSRRRGDGGGDATGGVALLIIDMVNAMDFEGVDRLSTYLDDLVDVVLGLRDAADAAGVPTIYVNDNYGHWHSERSRIIEDCRAKTAMARRLIDRIEPRDNDHFVIKPQVSGFYATSLPVLLPSLGASRLILTGIAADICVLFTAADAHMRAYDLWVPSDAVASSNPAHRTWALELMSKSLAAETAPTSALPLDRWVARSPLP